MSHEELEVESKAGVLALATKPVFSAQSLATPAAGASSSFCGTLEVPAQPRLRFHLFKSSPLLNPKKRAVRRERDGKAGINSGLPLAVLPLASPDVDHICRCSKRAVEFIAVVCDDLGR